MSKRRSKIVVKLRSGIQTSFTVVIFFVFSWSIINEFKKVKNMIASTSMRQTDCNYLLDLTGHLKLLTLP